MKKIFLELRRRNVLRAGAAYAVVAWVAVQAAAIIFPPFGVAEWVMVMVIVLLALGFPVTLALAWFYEWTAEGLHTHEEAEEKGLVRDVAFGRQIDFVIIALLIFAVAWLVFMTTTARQETEQRHAQAEKMVDFMINNLQQPLDSTGNLELLDSVGSEVLDYYASLDPEELSEESLARRSRALIMMGQIEDTRGDLGKAEHYFQAAFDTTKELMERAPGNGRRIFDHSQSSWYVGYIEWRRGKVVEAEKYFLDYRKFANRLIEIEPGNLEWQGEVGMANSTLGTLYFNSGKFSQAIEAFSRAHVTFEKLIAFSENPMSWKIQLGETHAWLADSHRTLGNLAAAIEHRLAQNALYQDILASKPGNLRVVDALVRNYRALATLSLYRGNIEEAKGYLETAFPLAETLLKTDPENTEQMYSVAALDLKYAEVLQHLHQTAAAKQRFLKARRMAEDLIAIDSSVLEWKTRLLNPSLLGLAQLKRATGKPREALDIATGAVANLAALREANPDNYELFSALCLAHYIVGEIYNDLDQGGAAKEAWERVLSLGAREEALDLEMKAILAKANVRLGNIEAAREAASDLENVGYRHPDFASFWRNWKN